MMYISFISRTKYGIVTERFKRTRYVCDAVEGSFKIIIVVTLLDKLQQVFMAVCLSYSSVCNFTIQK